MFRVARMKIKWVTFLLPFILSLGAHVAVAQTCEAGRWYSAFNGAIQPLNTRVILAGAARQDVVLLGEKHDDADHHLWQLQTLAALHVLRPEMAIGFEAFPRRMQPVLDDWIAGKLATEQFLERTEWKQVWRFAPELYLPLFQFARLNRIPMIALNVDPPLKDARVSLPAAALPAYENHLFEVFRQHDKGRTAAREDPAFRAFVNAQLTWDRAMAEALAARLRASGTARPLLVGIVGMGHVRHGHGIPHQLRDLAVTQVATLLPVSQAECTRLEQGLAEAVFVLPDRP